MPTFARQPSALSRADKVYYGFSVAMFLLTILLYTYPSIQAVQQVYEEQEVRAGERKLMAEHNSLVLEYEMLISPDEMEARSIHAGFVEPERLQIVYVKKK